MLNVAPGLAKEKKALRKISPKAQDDVDGEENRIIIEEQGIDKAEVESDTDSEYEELEGNGATPS